MKSTGFLEVGMAVQCYLNKTYDSRSVNRPCAGQHLLKFACQIAHKYDTFMVLHQNHVPRNLGILQHTYTVAQGNSPGVHSLLI